MEGGAGEGTLQQTRWVLDVANSTWHITNRFCCGLNNGL